MIFGGQKQKKRGLDKVRWQGISHGNSRWRSPLVFDKKSHKYFQWVQERWQRILFRLGIAIIVGLVFYLIFYSPFFLLSNVQIDSGNGNFDTSAIKNLADQELGSHRAYIFNRNNYFIFSSSTLEKKINDLYPNQLEKLDVSKKLSSHTVTIKFVEKNPSLLIKYDADYYYTDFQGNVINWITPNDFKKIDLTKQPLIVVEKPKVEVSNSNDNINNANVNEVAPTRLNSGQSAISTEILKGLLSWYDKIRPKCSDFCGNQFTVKEGESHLVKLTVQKGNWQIYFDPSGDLDRQLNSLNEVYNKIIKAQKIGIKYIDVRFDNQVVYQ